VAATSNNRVRFDAPSEAYIEGNQPFYDWCRFSFRCVPPKLAHKTRNEVSSKEKYDGAEAYESMCEFIASRVTKWSEEVPCDVENLLATNRHIVLRMYGILLDVERGDFDPAKGTKAESTTELLGKS
jgi:hypothetical protein